MLDRYSRAALFVLLVGGPRDDLLARQPAATSPKEARKDSSKELDAFLQRVAGKRRGLFGGGGQRQTRDKDGWIVKLNLKRVKQLEPADFPLIGELQHLETLDLSGSNVRDEDVRHLRGLKDLRTLSFWDTGVSSKALSHLSALVSLESLDVGDTKVDDGGLAHLAKLDKLRHLVLTRCPIGDDGLRHLAPLSPRLESLKLGETRISDAGLPRVANFPKLRSLTMERTKVSPQGLARLAELPNFVWISKAENTVSEFARRIERGETGAADDMLTIGLLFPKPGVFRLLSLEPIAANKRDTRLRQRRFRIEMRWTDKNRKRDDVMFAKVAVDRGSVRIQELGILDD